MGERSLLCVLKIEELGAQYSLISTVTIDPEPFPASVKVVLIGSPTLYYILYAYDEDFQKLFKVKADFTTRILQGSFEALPCERVHQALASRNDHVTSPCAVQCAGLDHGVVRDHAGPGCLMLNAAGKVVVSGVGLDNDRGALQLAVVD